MCSKVSTASRRTAFIATLANRPSRAWVSSAITMRTPPYAAVIVSGTAITQPQAGWSGLSTSASVAHLKVKGTAMVASLAASSSPSANSTRALRSARSEGHMYGHR